MRVIWILLKNNIKNLTAKSPVFTILFILLPVIISVGISLLIPSTKVFSGIILDQSGSVLSSAFVDSLSSNESMTIQVKKEADIAGEIKLGNYDFGILLDEDFDSALKQGNPAESVKVWSSDASGTLGIVKAAVQTELSRFSAICRADPGNEQENLEVYQKGKYNVESRNSDDSSYDYSAANMLFSFLIMFAFLRAMTGAFLISKDKELGIYTRLLLTPATEFHYYMANLLSNVILVAVQNGAALILIYLLSGVSMGGTGPEILLIILVLSFVAAALGDFFVAITDNKEIANILSTFVAIILLMAGIVPKEQLPEGALFLSNLIPTRWAVNCLELLQEGGGISDCALYLVLMLLSAIALLAITLGAVRRRSVRGGAV